MLGWSLLDFPYIWCGTQIGLHSKRGDPGQQSLHLLNACRIVIKQAGDLRQIIPEYRVEKV